MEVFVKQIIVDSERCIGCRRRSDLFLVKCNGAKSSPVKNPCGFYRRKGKVSSPHMPTMSGTFMFGSLPHRALTKAQMELFSWKRNGVWVAKMCVLACPYKALPILKRWARVSM